MEFNRIEYLVKKYYEGSCGVGEKKELADWLRNEPDEAILKQALERIWEKHEDFFEMPEAVSDRILWQIFQEQEESNTSRPSGPEQLQSLLEGGNRVLSQKTEVNLSHARSFRWWKQVGIAASVLALVGIAGWLMSREGPGIKDVRTDSQYVVATQKGSRSTVKLPDGTAVWLNVGSKLQYGAGFGEKRREVHLVGEAYFDVTHNPDVPFIIHTGAMDIKVLGTVFNVRAYPEEKTTETSLIKGAIEVSFPGREMDKIVLHPAEKIVVENRSAKEVVSADEAEGAVEEVEDGALPLLTLSRISFQPDSAVTETSWVYNKLLFRNKSFEEIIREMSRWYDVSFELKNREIADKRFTATFQNESAAEALDHLATSYKFSYSYDKATNTYIIK